MQLLEWLAFHIPYTFLFQLLRSEAEKKFVTDVMVFSAVQMIYLVIQTDLPDRNMRL